MDKENLHMRAIDAEISIRADADGKQYFEWYPAVFGQKSRLIRDWDGEYYEIIDPSAFDEILQKSDLNCLATVDHHPSKLIGRTNSGTCILKKDMKGLHASVLKPETTLGNDLFEQVKRGDYKEGSFIFIEDREKTEWDESGKIPVKTVRRITDLFDVSVVLNGAYAGGDVKTELRSRGWNFTDSGELEQLGNKDQFKKYRYDILRKRIQISKL